MRKTLLVLPVLVCIGLAAVLLLKRPNVDPVSGKPRLHEGEWHLALAPNGPWSVSIPGRQHGDLLCLNGERVPLKQGAKFIETLSVFETQGSMIRFAPAAADFPVFWMSDDTSQALYRCSDGSLLWQGPLP